LRAGDRSVQVCHVTWYVAALLASLLFLIVLPPLQSNDENEHFGRVWSVATEGLRCNAVPAVGWEFMNAVDYTQVRARRHAYRFANLDTARALLGTEELRRAWGSCYYSPLAYLLPGAAMHLATAPTDPTRPAGLVAGFYAARAVNWLLMGVAVLLLLLHVPELRNLTLVLYSLPMVMQQTISLNQDSAIFLLMAVMILVALRPPSVGQLVTLAAVLTGLTLVKVVYVAFVLVFVGAWLRLRSDGPAPRRRIWWALASLMLAPLLAQLVWSRWNAGVHAVVPAWANVGGQRAAVRAHPFVLVGALWHQLSDLFGRGKMNGGWPSILGVLGYAEHDIGERALHALGGAVLVALVADAVHPPRAGRRLRLWNDALLPIAAAVGVVMGTAIAMYFVFTSVGSHTILGMQGRYLHVPLFILLATGLAWAQARGERSRAVALMRRRAAPLLPWLAFGLCAIGVADAFATLARVYY
jgi:Predicted membrane protein (DUF2142)